MQWKHKLSLKEVIKRISPFKDISLTLCSTFKVQVKSDKLPHCNTKLPKTRKASHCMLHSGPFKTGTSPFITGIQRSKATTHCSQRLLSALQLPGYFRCKAYFKNCNLREIQRQFLESSLLRLKHRLKSYRTNTGRQITGYEEELRLIRQRRLTITMH